MGKTVYVIVKVHGVETVYFKRGSLVLVEMTMASEDGMKRDFEVFDTMKQWECVERKGYFIR